MGRIWDLSDRARSTVEWIMDSMHAGGSFGPCCLGCCDWYRDVVSVISLRAGRRNVSGCYIVIKNRLLEKWNAKKQLTARYSSFTTTILELRHDLLKKTVSQRDQRKKKQFTYTCDSRDKMKGVCWSRRIDHRNKYVQHESQTVNGRSTIFGLWIMIGYADQLL